MRARDTPTERSERGQLCCRAAVRSKLRRTRHAARVADDSEPSPPSIHRRSLDLLSIALPVSAGAVPPQIARALASSSRFTGSHSLCGESLARASGFNHVFKRRRLDRLNL